MVRKLKYHEKKLLKKVDFISWKSDRNLREVKILRLYHIQKREDYTKFVTRDECSALDAVGISVCAGDVTFPLTLRLECWQENYVYIHIRSLTLPLTQP